MARTLPSTRALQVFSAVARHGGVSRAAEQLALTHGAVSQQLNKLEAQLGIRLFRRSSRGLALTEAGLHYRTQVDDHLRRLEAHTLELMARREGEATLRIGCVPVLAERWLAPRLGGFLARQPRVSLEVKVFPTNIVLAEPHYDVAIQYGNAAWPGARAEPLMQETCVAVCAPRAAFRAALGKGDFRAVPLLHLSTRPEAWQQWFAQARGVRAPANPLAGHRFELFSALAEAVRAGIGVGLLPAFHAGRELGAGDFALAHPLRLAGTQSYSVFVPDHRSDAPLVAAFVQWLHEAAADQLTM